MKVISYTVHQYQCLTCCNFLRNSETYILPVTRIVVFVQKPNHGLHNSSTEPVRLRNHWVTFPYVLHCYNRCLDTCTAAPMLGIKEVCKDCELITLTQNMLTGLSCVGVVIILHSAAAVRKSNSCERRFIYLPQSSLRAWLTMKDSKNQGTQGWKRRRETDKRGYNVKGHGERGNRKKYRH